MSIQIFSPLTANKNSSKVITAAEESSSPPRGKQEEGKRRGEERGMEEEEGNTEGFFFSSAASHSRGKFQIRGGENMFCVSRTAAGDGRNKVVTIIAEVLSSKAATTGNKDDVFRRKEGTSDLEGH